MSIRGIGRAVGRKMGAALLALVLHAVVAAVILASSARPAPPPPDRLALAFHRPPPTPRFRKPAPFWSRFLEVDGRLALAELWNDFSHRR